MNKWKIGCGALAALAIVVVVAAGGWVYGEFRTHEIEIRNETRDTLYVRSGNEASAVCPVTLIAVGTTGTFKDDSFLCKKPRLTFSSPSFGDDAVCDWDDADENQPVLVTDTSVSCSRTPIPTPFSTPLSPPHRFPTPTPDR